MRQKSKNLCCRTYLRTLFQKVKCQTLSIYKDSTNDVQYWAKVLLLVELVTLSSCHFNPVMMYRAFITALRKVIIQSFNHSKVFIHNNPLLFIYQVWSVINLQFDFVVDTAAFFCCARCDPLIMAASGIRCRCNTITTRFRNTTAKF